MKEIVAVVAIAKQKKESQDVSVIYLHFTLVKMIARGTGRVFFQLLRQDGGDPSQVVLRDGFTFTLLGCEKNTWLTKKNKTKLHLQLFVSLTCLHLLEWKSSEMLVVSQLKKLSN